MKPKNKHQSLQRDERTYCVYKVRMERKKNDNSEVKMNMD